MPMTPDLQMLVWSAALTLVQMVVAAIGAQNQVGLPTLAGNREDLPAATGWAGRARRAHLNMLESLVVFAIVVLVAHAAGRANAMTALGAALFFWARLGYAVIYVAGVPWLRTAVWAVSIGGILLIFSQLL
ncbi:MAG TPA: MAPEG family protein [Allosphingosinicella sp.]